MAQHLAKIFGTEEDKVNCPFYLKMGACRHGDRCSRIHNRPILSQTILLQNMVSTQERRHTCMHDQLAPPDSRRLILALCSILAVRPTATAV